MGGTIFVEVFDSTCQNYFTNINIHLDIDQSPTPHYYATAFDHPVGSLSGWFDISEIDLDPEYNGQERVCTCGTRYGDFGENLERRCVIFDLLVDTHHAISIAGTGQDAASIAVDSAVAEQVTTPVVFLDDGTGNARSSDFVYDESPENSDILLNFQSEEGLVFVDIDLYFNSPLRGTPLIQPSWSQIPIVDENSIPNVIEPCEVLPGTGPTQILVSWPIQLQDLGRPGEVVDLTFSGTLYTDIGGIDGRRQMTGKRALETQKAKVIPFNFAVRARAPGKKRLSPAAYGGIVFAMTFVIGIAGAFAYAVHKRRANPQVYPAKKSTDAKTLKTCTTISSFGSDRSIDSNIRSVPTGVIKSQRDIETQPHAPRSQRSMKSPPRINDSEHIAKAQSSTKPTKSNKSTTRADGSDHRPRSHRDASSSRGCHRNMEHNRVASPRATTGRNGGRSTSQGNPKPSTRPASRNLPDARSQPSTSPKHHRKERKPTPKCHPSNEELV